MREMAEIRREVGSEKAVSVQKIIIKKNHKCLLLALLCRRWQEIPSLGTRGQTDGKGK